MAKTLYDTNKLWRFVLLELDFSQTSTKVRTSSLHGNFNLNIVFWESNIQFQQKQYPVLMSEYGSDWQHASCTGM